MFESSTQMLHVWYIYTYIWMIFGTTVDTYTSTMEHMGWDLFLCLIKTAPSDRAISRRMSEWLRNQPDEYFLTGAGRAAVLSLRWDDWADTIGMILHDNYILLLFSFCIFIWVVWYLMMIPNDRMPDRMSRISQIECQLVGVTFKARHSLVSLSLVNCGFNHQP